MIPEIDLVSSPPQMAIDIDKFRAFAKARHAGQRRRDGSDYFGHCENVALRALQIAGQMPVTLSQAGQQALLCAAMGHDLYEDTRTDFDDVARVAGVEVATLIYWVSDDKRLPGQQRHDEYVARLRAAPLWAQVIKLADLGDNIEDSFGLLDLPDVPTGFLERWCMRAYQALDVLGRVKEACGPGVAGVRARLDDIGIQVCSQITYERLNKPTGEPQDLRQGS